MAEKIPGSSVRAKRDHTKMELLVKPLDCLTDDSLDLKQNNRIRYGKTRIFGPLTDLGIHLRPESET